MGSASGGERHGIVAAREVRMGLSSGWVELAVEDANQTLACALACGRLERQQTKSVRPLTGWIGQLGSTAFAGKVEGPSEKISTSLRELDCAVLQLALEEDTLRLKLDDEPSVVELQVVLRVQALLFLVFWQSRCGPVGEDLNHSTHHSVFELERALSMPVREGIFTQYRFRLGWAWGSGPGRHY